MKKIILVFSIFFLIIITTITKNSTKKLESEIFNTKENIKALKDKLELVFLDYNFLTTPHKLIQYRSMYFKNDLVILDINEIKELNIRKDQLIISDFKQKKINNE